MVIFLVCLNCKNKSKSNWPSDSSSNSNNGKILVADGPFLHQCFEQQVESVDIDRSCNNTDNQL